MQTLRDILVEHPTGISRAGLLAWAQLRIDPAYDGARLEADLAALGGQVDEADGFLKLRSEEASGAPSRWSTPAPTTTLPETGPEPEPPAASGGGWIPPEPSSGWIPPEPSSAWIPPGASPGWIPPGASPTGGPPAEPSSLGSTGWIPPADAGAGPGADGAWVVPSDGGSRRRMIVIAGIAGLVAVGGILAMTFASLGDTIREIEDGLATPDVLMTPDAGGSVGDAFDMAPGDCVDLPGGGEFSEVTFHDCTEPHDIEVYFLGEMPAGDFPTDDAFDSWVDMNCGPAFAAYTGSELDSQGELDIGYFVPTESGWSGGDHEVVCYLGRADGEQADRSYAGANP